MMPVERRKTPFLLFSANHGIRTQSQMSNQAKIRTKPEQITKTKQPNSNRKTPQGNDTAGPMLAKATVELFEKGPNMRVLRTPAFKGASLREPRSGGRLLQLAERQDFIIEIVWRGEGEDVFARRWDFTGTLQGL